MLAASVWFLSGLAGRAIRPDGSKGWEECTSRLFLLRGVLPDHVHTVCRGRRNRSPRGVILTCGRSSAGPAEGSPTACPRTIHRRISRLVRPHYLFVQYSQTGEPGSPACVVRTEREDEAVPDARGAVFRHTQTPPDASAGSNAPQRSFIDMSVPIQPVPRDGNRAVGISPRGRRLTGFRGKGR